MDTAATQQFKTQQPVLILRNTVFFPSIASSGLSNSALNEKYNHCRNFLVLYRTLRIIALPENIFNIWQLAICRVCALGQGRGLSKEHAQHLLALCLILISILLSCPGMPEFPCFLKKKKKKITLSPSRKSGGGAGRQRKKTLLV